MADDKNITQQKVIEGNLLLHDEEHAVNYDRRRYEIFGYFEQRRIVRELRKLEPSGRICLDIGAGTGNLTEKLLRLGAKQVVAVELSSYMIAVMKDKLLPQYADRLTIVNTDVDSFLDNNGQKFNIICEYSVLHHLPNYLVTLEEIKKHLSENGYLYLDHEPAIDCVRPGLMEKYDSFCNFPNRVCHVLKKAIEDPSLIVKRIRRKSQRHYNLYDCERPISWQDIDQILKEDKRFRIIREIDYLGVPKGLYKLVLWFVFRWLISDKLRVFQKII